MKKRSSFISFSGMLRSQTYFTNNPYPFKYLRNLKVVRAAIKAFPCNMDHIQV